MEGVSQNSTVTSGVAALDDERRYQAAVSKDPRFDGVFFIGVTSTGIYCRPSCPAMTPKREHMRFYKTPAAAQLAGFRACKRCRPDASPGSPEWNIRADMTARAMRLIADGAIDVAPLLSHLLPIDRVEEAFRIAHERTDGALKVSVRF